MTRTWILTAAFVLAGAALMFGQGKGQGKGKGKEQVPANSAQEQSGSTRVNMNIRFGTDESRIIREFYGPRMGQLPPGLQKKVARGGTLPPGWQKKVQGFPSDLSRRLPALPEGYRRVLSGNTAWLVHDATNVLVDLLELR